MTELMGVELEDFGQEVFDRMGLTCVNRLSQVHLRSLNPKGLYGQDEHLEIDYLIPYKDTCLVGEITGRSIPADVRSKYGQFTQHCRVLEQQDVDEELWYLLGVPEERLRDFREIRQLRALYITTKLQRFDVSLADVPRIARFYRSDWDLLVEYSESIGSWARPHFLHRFGIEHGLERESLTLHGNEHGLVHIPNAKVASGVGLADLYTFEINPYALLPLAQVFRRDELPTLSSEPVMAYQRLLLPRKLSSIRSRLLTEPDFVFPGSILVVLSGDCSYSDPNGVLTIPKRYGAVAVIDGQHRLFSYANHDVETRVRDNSRIMVTAIQFQDAKDEQIRRYSAQTFVEINTNQTRIQRTHLDAIAYDILGETTPRALAAQVILRVNERRGSKLYGLFDTNKTGLGIIQATTVLTSVAAMTNLRRVQGLANAQRGASFDKRRGYERLFHASASELCDPENLIAQGVVCLEHYFSLVGRIFHHDWPERGVESSSSLRYAKMVAGFVKLLWKDFISAGCGWDDIEVELEKVKENVMRLRKMDSYDSVLFDPANSHIPDADPRDNDDYRFLSRNRHRPTSIQVVLADSSG